MTTKEKGSQCHHCHKFGHVAINLLKLGIVVVMQRANKAGLVVNLSDNY